MSLFRLIARLQGEEEMNDAVRIYAVIASMAGGVIFLVLVIAGLVNPNKDQ